MQRFSVPYGKKQISVTFPDHIQVDLIIPNQTIPVTDALEAVYLALESPVGGEKLTNYKGIKSAAIAINDKTRPVPHEYLLPPLLNELDKMGVQKEAITFIIATGTHLPLQSDEFSEVVPKDILNNYRVMTHDANDKKNLVYLGKTARGTRVEANRYFMDSDLRIVVGNIEPHHFMGFSGGVKTAAIGLTAWSTINTNHALMMHPDARLGSYEKNPVRQDVEDIGRMMDVHFALNAILNEDKEIIRVFAGAPLPVVQAGIPVARELFEFRVDKLYDLVLASPGGHPRDINFYQSEKSLSEASMITRDGGYVILAAACPEGSGSKSYEQWVENVHSHSEVLERIRKEHFRIGPHKAWQVAREATRVNVLLVSDMPEQQVHKLLLNPIEDVQKAVDNALSKLVGMVRIAIMPLGNAMIPIINTEDQL